MSRKTNNFVSIVGLIFIFGICMIPIDKSADSQFAKDFAQLPDRVQAHLSDCFAPGGINDQIATNGIVQTWKNGVQTFDDGKGHYATNNHHNQNNRNPQSNTNYAYDRGRQQQKQQRQTNNYEEDDYYQDNVTYNSDIGSTQIELPTWLRITLIILVVFMILKNNLISALFK